MNVQGRVHKYGDNVDTDVIIPARYLNTADHKELASHCMEDIDKAFTSKVKVGDIMVGGANFGCGSSREHAPIAIKNSGISCVIDGDDVSIDFDTGIITNNTKNESYQAEPFPDFVKKIIEADGLMNSLRKQ